MSMIVELLALKRAVQFSMIRRSAFRNALFICFALSISAGCQPPSGISTEDLIGIWKTGYGKYVQFKADGTFSVAGNIDGLTSAPVEYGEYHLEGTELIFIPNKESRNCPGQTGHYQVEISEEGKIEMALIEDYCSRRASDLQSGPLRMYSP